MKTITIIEDLILEANRKDTLMTKLGLNQENAELLEELTGPLSIIIGNKLIDVFAQRQLEYFSSAVPEDEERRMREEFKKNPEYRKKMGADAINKSGGVRLMRSNIVSIMDWVRIGLNGDISQYKNLDFNNLYSESRKWHNELTSGEGDINYVEKNEIIRRFSLYFLYIKSVKYKCVCIFSILCLRAGCKCNPIA